MGAPQERDGEGLGWARVGPWGPLSVPQAFRPQVLPTGWISSSLFLLPSPTPLSQSSAHPPQALSLHRPPGLFAPFSAELLARVTGPTASSSSPPFFLKHSQSHCVSCTHPGRCCLPGKPSPFPDPGVSWFSCLILGLVSHILPGLPSPHSVPLSPHYCSFWSSRLPQPCGCRPGAQCMAGLLLSSLPPMGSSTSPNLPSEPQTHTANHVLTRPADVEKLSGHHQVQNILSVSTLSPKIALLPSLQPCVSAQGSFSVQRIWPQPAGSSDPFVSHPGFDPPHVLPSKRTWSLILLTCTAIRPSPESHHLLEGLLLPLCPFYTAASWA